MNSAEKNLEFEEVRQRYAELRREQKKLIREYLHSRGFDISCAQGIGDYTCGGEFKVPYDLSNWQWLYVKENGKKVMMISLQTFDQDKNSKNYHVLMDRLGIFVYGDAETPKESYREMKQTDIDLPMTEEKLERLAELVKANMPFDNQKPHSNHSNKEKNQ